MNTTKTNGSTLEQKTYEKLDKFADKFDGAAHDLKDKAGDYLAKGMEGAESARDSITEITERITQNVSDAVEKGFKTLKSTSGDAEKFVKKYPIYIAAGAVVAAFVAGMVYRDRK